MQEKIYMAISQYGETIHGLKHPRKDLAERLGVSPSTLKKQYTERKDRTSYHSGYILLSTGDWFTLYEVKPFGK